MPIRRIPSLNWLRVFEAAARHQSFSRAGNDLNMSGPAISQQIKALEGHLDAKLFERGSRAVTLTEAGRAFLPVVRQSLLSVETTAASLFGQARHRTVTIKAPTIFAASWLARNLPDFHAANPDIQVHVMSDDGDDLMSREGIDLSIIYGGTPVSEGDSTALFGETIYPLATPDLAAAITDPAELLGHTLIEISSHRTSWLSLFEAAGVTDLAQARFCFTDSTVIAMSMAAAGQGIALARAPASGFLSQRLGLVRCLDGLDVKSGLSYHLAMRSLGALSPASVLFRDWLLKITASLR
jgi:LysR family transcriptional regulator, glycine cleavage system transcriptional activator